MGNTATYIAALLFAFMAIVHLGRIFCPFTVQIGDFIVPEWGSYFAFIIFGLLSAFLFRDSRGSKVP